MSSVSSDDYDSYDSEDSDSCIYYSPTDRSIGSDEDPNEICYPYPIPLKTKVMEAVPTSVANLKEIASLNVAIALWKHVNIIQATEEISKGNAKNFKLDLTIYKEVLQITNDLFMPKSLTKVIIAYLDKIRNEVKDWVSYNFRRVFFDYTSDHFLYNHIHHMVFYSNGTINRKETARNLSMNSPRLSEIEKYYLLCTYCMENELKCLSHMLPPSHDVNVCDFDRHPLIYYWNCVFRNEVDKISVPETECIDILMIKHRGVDNWPAKEYFLDHLSFDEQVRMAVWLIDKHDMKYLQLLLMKLDDHQRIHLMALRSTDIISMLICTKRNFEETLSMWFEIRDLHYVDKMDFLMIFNLLLNEELYDLLETIWTSVSVDFRDYVLNVSNESAFARMLRQWTSDPEKDTFFCIMQYANEDFKVNITKKSFFIKACEKLVYSDKLKHLDRLLKLCFTDFEKLAQFKKEFVAKESFARYCKMLMSNNEHKILRDLLNSFFTDAEELAMFKQSLKVNFIAKEIRYLYV